MFPFSSFLPYVFITAYTPGPNNILSMSNASRLGFRRSFPFNLGILLGFSIVMLLCAVFSAALFTFLPKVRPVMLALGAGYMLFLAYKTLRGGSSLQADKKNSRTSGFLSGFLLQFVNPKIIIYGVTSLSTYILPFTTEPLWVCLSAIFLALVGFSGTLCWALFGSMLSRLFSQHARAVNVIMALLLVYCTAALFF